MEGLDSDSLKFLQGLCFQMSGMEPWTDPLSEDFGIRYGIKSVVKTKESLVARNIIEENYRFIDPSLRHRIDVLCYPPLGLPPLKWRLFPRVEQAPI